MSNAATPRKPRRPIKGSDHVTARLPNRVIRKIKPAARRLGITKNAVVSRAVEEFVERVLSPAA